MEKTGKEQEMDFSGTVFEMLEKLGENPVSVLVVKNGELLTEEDKLENSDLVKILSVVSGG